MDWDVENDDLSCEHCFINSHTISEANNQNSIDSTNKVMDIFSMYLKWKILEYRIRLTSIICYLHQQLINILI